MKKNNSFISYLIVGLFIIALISIMYLSKYLNKEKFELNPNYKVETIENYEVNQYIPVMINDEQMSRKYLLDYINSVYSNMDNSYNLLNLEYRNERFGSVDAYKDFINSLNINNGVSVSRYATYEKGNYKYYDIYDNNDNRYIFRTNGVMQYELFFDDDTVKI